PQMRVRASGQQKTDAEMLGIGQVHRELVCLYQLRTVVNLCFFRHKGEVTNEFAASAKSPAGTMCFMSGIARSRFFSADAISSAARSICRVPSAAFLIAKP